MKVVGEIEKQNDSKADSSFHPEPYVSPHNTRSTLVSDESNSDLKQDQGADASCRYLPCHYFDYIGGTSTG